MFSLSALSTLRTTFCVPLCKPFRHIKHHYLPHATYLVLPSLQFQHLFFFSSALQPHSMLSHHSEASLPIKSSPFHSTHVHQSSPQCLLPPLFSLERTTYMLSHLLHALKPYFCTKSLCNAWHSNRPSLPAEFLDTPLAISLPLPEITAGPDTVQRILSILRKPESDLKLFAKQVKLLRKCGEITQATVDKKLTNL